MGRHGRGTARDSQQRRAAGARADLYGAQPEPDYVGENGTPGGAGKKARAGIATGVTLAVLAGLGGVAYADARDLVSFPGFLTTAPPHPEPSPFPEVAGALQAPPVTPLLPNLPKDAPMPSAQTVQSLVDELLRQPAMGPHVGVLIVDELTGEVLGHANENNTFTPASTQKILTGIASFSVLDPQTRLATLVRQDGSRLILVGGGDMLLAAGAGHPDQIDDHAGLDDLAALTAAQVKLTGRTAVTLEFDDTLFEDPRIAPAVPAGEQYRFVAPVAALAVNQARTTLTDKSDMAARWNDPALVAARLFADALAAHGVTVEGEVRRTQGPSDQIPEIARVESATIGEITEWAMQRSDNTLTEVIGRLVALETGFPPTTVGSVEAVKRAVANVGVDLTGASLVDLSGLGRGSELTPRHLIDLVGAAVRGDHTELRPLAIGLPIAGLSGTLHDRFPGATYAIGTTRAKTGSLPGVTALAGTIVTAGDRLLLFVIVADQTPGPGQWGARQAMDRFVEQIAQFGG